MTEESEYNFPDFNEDPKLWFAIWRSVNWQWEKYWASRTEKTEAWWIGRMAGQIFRLREISGFADAYFHGSLTAGSGELSPKGRKFDETKEWEHRKRIHKMLGERKPEHFELPKTIR